MRLRDAGAKRDIIALLFLAALVVAFFHKALIGGEQFYAGDTYRFFYPLKKMAADYVRAGHAPVWNPLVHSGAPLHAALQAAVFYPGSLLFYLLPFDFAYKWYVALHVLLAAAGIFFLMRRWRLEREPAALAGVTYAFSGYMISFTDGLNIFTSIAWLPVIFLLFERAIERPGLLAAALAALAFAAQILAGDPVSGYLTFLLCAFYWMATLAAHALRRKPRRETAARLLVLPAVAALAFLLSYVQLAPSAELTRLSTRTIPISYEGATAHSLAPLRLLELFVPYLFGNPLEYIYDWGRIFAPHFPLLRSVYVGAAAIALVPVALGAVRGRRIYFFAGALAVSLLLSLGDATPVYGIAYRLLPVFSKLRYPTKVFFITTFALALLSGWGFQVLFSRNAANAFVKRYCLLVLVLCAAWLGFSLIDTFALDLTGSLFLKISSADAALTERFIPYMKRQILQAGIVFAALSAGLWLRQRGSISQRPFVLLVIVFVVLDVLPTNTRAMDTISAEFYSPPKADRLLRAEPRPFRLYRTPLDVEQRIEGLDLKTPTDYYLWNREILSPNFGTLFGYAYTDGYESANLLWHNLFIRFVEGAPPRIRPRLLGLVNVKYIFSSHPVTHPDLTLKGSPVDNVYLYENETCLDRAYFVPEAVVAADEAKALQVLASDGFDPRRSVALVEKGGPGSLSPVSGDGSAASGFEVRMPPGFRFQAMDVPDDAAPRSPRTPAKPPNPVRIEKRSPNSVVLTVDAPSGGYVVLCDAYYPRWQVYVNGERRKGLRANCAVRAVQVAKGNSAIEFAYDTSPLRSAAMVSLAGLMLCALLGVFDVMILQKSGSATREP